MTSDLDRQIASVLGNGADLQSSELAELLSEAETEAFLANETAENERKAMVDPTVLSVIEHKRKAEEAELNSCTPAGRNTEVTTQARAGEGG